MKLAVIGSRSFSNYKLLCEEIAPISPSMIISGGAIGTDSLAERYATSMSLEKKIFLPDWQKYGKGAGFVRNSLIVKEADIVLAFWDGKSKGTKHSMDLCTKIGKKLITIFYDNV